MVEVKQFSGVLDTDNDFYTIEPRSHSMAFNIRFRGAGRNLRVENVPGTTLVTNSLLPAGTNITIGAWFDAVKQRVFSFNYNSNTNHGIYIFDVNAQTWAALLVVGSATNGDILGFTPNVPIHSVNVLYSEQTDGDMLFYIDSLLRPTAFNINRYLNTPYAITKRSFIDVAKAPPRMEPKCTYCNDFTINVNNLRNSLFQFKEKFVFDDQQKSVISSGSAIVLPNVRTRGAEFGFGHDVIDDNFNLNSRIDIYMQTGDADIKKLELWGRQVVDSGAPNQQTDTSSSDYFLIQSLDKAALSIQDNSIYVFRFYNDGVYPVLDIKDNLLLFDYIPRQANTQELLNGNVPIYGGITEGYDKVNVSISIAATNQNYIGRNTYNGALFFAAQSGKDSIGTAGDPITIYIDGTGANDGFGNVSSFFNNPFPATQPVFYGGEIFYINCSSASFTYTLPIVAPPPTYSVSGILAGIQAAAVSAGYSVVSIGATSITIQQASVILYSSQFVNTHNVSEPPTQFAGEYLNIHFAYPHQSAEDYSIEYLDDKGRTNGASVQVNTVITTPEDVTGYSIPQLQLTITSRPPTWAKYWRPLRANNLTYNKHLFWVSNQVFNYVDLNSNIKYAYIGITNMVLYNQNNQAATPVVNYDFATGDRMRFMLRYPSNSSIGVNLQAFDYEIVAVIANPSINGTVQNGRFIKIVYPTADIGANFKFPDPTDPSGIEFQNYNVLIYNYIKHISDQSEQTYFEFGRTYGIGNSGTATAFHVGTDQTQSADLVTPSIIRMDEGNFFWRFRNVPAGAVYQDAAGNYAFSEQYTTMYVQPDNGDVITSLYTISHQQNLAAGILSTDYPKFTDDKMLYWNTSTVSQTIRVRSVKNPDGTGGVKVQCKAGDSTYTSVQLKIVTATGVTLVPLIKRFDLPLGEDLEFYTFDFDGYAQVPAGAKVWILAQNARQVINIRYGIFNLEVQNVRNIEIPIIESSYSDKYNIVINSNSRPIAFDPNAKSVYYSTLYRWGLPFELNTNINQTNRFFPDNFDEADRGKGDIRRFKVRDRIMRIFQDRAVGQVAIFGKFIIDGQDTQLLSTTTDIIASNNINYYAGNFGLDGYPTSLVSTKIADYFPDITHGYFVRLSGDGMIPISELYKGQFYLRNLLIPYNKNFVRPNGFAANIIGCYNYLEEEYVPILQGGTVGASTINDYTLSFNEKRNSFTSFFDFHPDVALSVNEDIYTFVGGQLYIHNNQTAWNNFYGVQYPSIIELSFNENQAIKKTFKSIGYESNKIWESPSIGDVKTSLLSAQTNLQQISNLPLSFYTIRENVRVAAFRRDANSDPVPVNGLANGYRLKGKWVKVKLICNNNGDFVYLYSPYVNTKTSPRAF